MKIKIVSKKNYSSLKKELTSLGISVVDESNLTLYDEDSYIEYIITNEENKRLIKVDDILYIDSYGHDVFIHTMEHEYKIKETLYSLENKLDSRDFIRINISTIINKNKISMIKPSIQTKFKLVMENEIILIVSRTYYFKFKELLKL